MLHLLHLSCSSAAVWLLEPSLHLQSTSPSDHRTGIHGIWLINRIIGMVYHILTSIPFAEDVWGCKQIISPDLAPVVWKWNCVFHLRGFKESWVTALVLWTTSCFPVLSKTNESQKVHASYNIICWNMLQYRKICDERMVKTSYVITW